MGQEGGSSSIQIFKGYSTLSKKKYPFCILLSPWPDGERNSGRILPSFNEGGVTVDLTLMPCNLQDNLREAFLCHHIYSSCGASGRLIYFYLIRPIVFNLVISASSYWTLGKSHSQTFLKCLKPYGIFLYMNYMCLVLRFISFLCSLHCPFPRCPSLLIYLFLISC